ncbi:hypothetical protein DFH09DRAFT_1094711 [Mycena vulgaris]|nr:hypothetical protein DFH09DRAFT_1345333 [Mycena vulgaris]KAJ6527916.1 hypothetical protein DFH09DRAFT_1094711 [Mycena vulgaris]
MPFDISRAHGGTKTSASMEQSNSRKLTLRDYIRHNILPSDGERKSIIDAVNAARKRLSEIRATPRSAAHNAEETTLRQYIADYSSLVAPVRLLSHDILETIFLAPEIHGVVAIGEVEPSSVVGRHNPQILASVSHYWRCVALDTPRLWSSFSVNGCRGAYSLRHLLRCLERSKGAPLSITLDLASGLPPNQEILDAIMAHAERWIDFSIMSPPYQYLHLFAPVRGRLHRLERISFSFSEGLNKFADGEYRDAFEDAPNLRTRCSSAHSARWGRFRCYRSTKFEHCPSLRWPMHFWEPNIKSKHVARFGYIFNT